MIDIHETNTTAKQIIDADELPKTIFERETESLGLSLCLSSHGIALCKNDAITAVEDAFPSHYVKAARVHATKFAKVWLVPTSFNECTPGDLLRQLYEAFGVVEYRIQFPKKKRWISEFTWQLNRHFLGLDQPTGDPNGPELLPVSNWRKGVRVETEEIELFAATAQKAARNAVDDNETGPTLYEAVCWLTYIYKLAQNPHRQKDAKTFSEFIVRKIAKRAGVQP
ncbi:hypothetical protein [Salibaculum griseiflavum]|uniref:Uncharacterized protein n=1 Tax=Salibaculum griseiflavum TaxID=1914409 RepID=A0A2V1P1Z1_9RHOB|nr:hypothetical protein [Salibaculum griseiflavum]PWG16336.1 hypothetical protein DFK10_11875 [Salibaculum griseiflavum]